MACLYRRWVYVIARYQRRQIRHRTWVSDSTSPSVLDVKKESARGRASFRFDIETIDKVTVASFGRGTLKDSFQIRACLNAGPDRDETVEARSQPNLNPYG